MSRRRGKRRALRISPHRQPESWPFGAGDLWKKTNPFSGSLCKLMQISVMHQFQKLMHYRKFSGDPDPKHVSTSYVERHNLTMQMGMRRFTSLTNGFSKKVENHIAMVAIHAVYYNFARIHKTLRITPSMAAGLSDHV